MIIFYDEATGYIIGTIDGRVHHKGHLNMTIYQGNPKQRIARSIIGVVDTGKLEDAPHPTDPGRTLKKTIYIEHNMHLWDHHLQFENPRHPKNAIDYKVVREGGKIVDFIKK